MSMVPSGSALPAIPAGDNVGLEDFDLATDAVMPRIQIDHREGLYVDSLTNETHERMDVILLGLCKGRVLWPEEVADNAKPLCKSYNFREGHPDETLFPWRASGFSPDQPTPLSCEDCKLKEWGSGQNGSPWCTEQHNFALLTQQGDPADDLWTPALLTLQRSGLKPSRAYCTSFARSKTPLYTVQTTIGLTQHKKGSVPYAVPSFIKGAPTDPDLWSYFADQYRTIAGFITAAPVGEDETPVGSPASSSAGSSSSGPAAGATPVSTPPAKPADVMDAASTVGTPAEPAGDDDLPW